MSQSARGNLDSYRKNQFRISLLLSRLFLGQFERFYQVLEKKKEEEFQYGGSKIDEM